MLAMLKHGAGIGRGKAAQLGLEIKEDGVGLPVAEGANGSLVNTGDEEGGGTPGPEAVGFDAVGGDVGDVVDSGGSTVEGAGDVAGGDIVGPAGGVIVLIQGSVRGGGEGAEVFHVVAEGTDGAKVDFPGCAVSKSFPMGTVLLISVGKGHVGPLLHVMQGAVIGRNALDKGAAECSVSEAERLASAMVGSRREGVLAQVAEEEESKGGQVKDGLGSGLVLVMGKACDEGTEDGNVDGPHPGRGGVLIHPGLEEGLKSEGVIDAVQAGIWEAQLGELLAHGT